MSGLLDTTVLSCCRGEDGPELGHHKQALADQMQRVRVKAHHGPARRVGKAGNEPVSRSFDRCQQRKLSSNA